MSISITFFSNFFNAHQLPVALELDSNPDVKYAFVSLDRVDGLEGRSCLDDDYPFVVKKYLGGSSALEAIRHALHDDIVVFGDMAGNEEYVRERAKTGRPFFRYSERLLKRGDWWAFFPPKRWRTFDRFCRYRKCNMYVLCASGYTAGDLKKFGFPIERCLKWGYFPSVNSECAGERDASFRRNLALCSVQRLIPLKRVDIQLQMVKRITDLGMGLTLDIAGSGEEETRLRKLADQLGIADKVRFLGTLDSDEAKALMRRSDVFLATSNRKEGWGATLNEAMAEGCAVVASNEIGSAPFLIEQGKDGIVFRSGDVESLVSAVVELGTDWKRRHVISQAGQEKAFKLWGARCAAERLVEASRHLLSTGVVMPYENGPLSEACVIDEYWYLE